jgi:outer membrane receptor for ferrienterochelin and colicins
MSAKSSFLVVLLFFVALQSAFSQDSLGIYKIEDVQDMDLWQLVKVRIATKSEQALEQAPSIVSVISAREIRDMGARELVDVLQMVPGFEITRNTGGQFLIGVRGVKDPRFPCKILIMGDGQPVNSIFYGVGESYGYKYDLENIERIEIIRGPGSPLYGRNAFSAVINLISKTAKNDKASAKIEAGTFNTYSSHITFGSQCKKFNYHFSFYNVKSDGTNATFPTTSDLWTVNHENQVYNADFNYKGFKISGSFVNEKIGKWQNGGEVRRKSGFYSLEYNHKFSDVVSFRTRFYAQNADHIEDLQIVKPDISTGFPGLFVLPSFKEYLYALEAETNLHLSENSDLFLGIQGDIRGVNDVEISSNFNLNDGTIYQGIGHDNQIKFEPGWFKNNGHDYSNLAFYVQEVYSIVKNVTVTLGARYDIESQIGGSFNPRLGVVWNFASDAFFKVMYGEAYRSPSPSQQYQTSGFAMGNENLLPEKIRAFEASLSYRLGHISTQVNVFRNKMKNMIYAEKYITTDVTHTPTNRNMGENVAKGIEVECKWSPMSRLYSFINYSYTVSENTDVFFDGSEKTYQHVDVSPHKLNAGINWMIGKYINFNTTMMYRSRMKKFFTYNSKTGQYSDVSKDPVGDYAIFNTTLRFMAANNFNASVSVYNLFNKKYYAQEPFIANVPEQGNRQLIFRIGYFF